MKQTTKNKRLRIKRLSQEALAIDHLDTTLKTVEKKGYESGYLDGVNAGKWEGHKKGLQTGINIGVEQGKLRHRERQIREVERFKYQGTVQPEIPYMAKNGVIEYIRFLRHVPCEITQTNNGLWMLWAPSTGEICGVTWDEMMDQAIHAWNEWSQRNLK